jgi:hypothetical protein
VDAHENPELKWNPENTHTKVQNMLANTKRLEKRRVKKQDQLEGDLHTPSKKNKKNPVKRKITPSKSKRRVPPKEEDEEDEDDMEDEGDEVVDLDGNDDEDDESEEGEDIPTMPKGTTSVSVCRNS